ncbi:MAG: response regulator [Candidatus Aminicenantes bacterium]|nr:MAG: response regulator [Candidatus Aminicenantes bacterium]
MRERKRGKMVRRFKFNSVKSRLVFLFSMVALIPLVIVSGIVYRQRAQSIKSREFTKLVAIRDLKVEQVNAWLDERIGDIRMVAEDHEIRLAAGAFYNQTAARLNRREVKNARELLSRYVRNYESFYELFVIDAGSGKIVISSRPYIEGNDRFSDPYFTGALQTKEPYIKDIYYSKTIKGPSMTFSCPIFSLSHADEVAGVAVARINLERSLYDLLLHRTGLGETGETLIVNKNLIALNELRWYGNAPFNLKITAKPAAAASRGETGILESTDYRDVKILAAFTHIPRTGWGFVAKQDRKEVYAPIAAMLKSLIAITVIFAAVIIFIAVLTANTIARPVLEMTEVSGKIREGDLSARNIIRQKDELGFLGQVFNEMTDSIQSQIQVQQKSAEITRVMVESKTLEGFSHQLLKKFMEVTDSHFGVFFTLDREKKIFKCTGSIGANIERIKSFKADILEGEIGVALADRKISHITNIPPDTIFKFKTFAGTLIPKDILTIPILIDNKTAAVISLASLKPYSQESLEISNHVWLSLNTAFSNLLAGINTVKLAEDLKEKNKEIIFINEELKQQAEELKIQRQHLAEADRLKTEFLSNMSHELRTPLNSILALSQLMIAKGTGQNPGKEKENLRVIERNGRILLDLISGLLDLAKIESGRLDVNLTDFKPKQVVTAAMEIIRPMAQSKGLILEINIENNPNMYSDRARIQQILFNLLSNAAKFTKQGEIGITVTAPGDMIFFTVRDTGPGIKSKDLAYIFDEFKQVDGSAAREFEGTGLGLAISRKFARLLGGDITVESEWGKGSVFTLALPVRCQEKKETLSHEPDDIWQQDSHQEVRPGESPRILIIEDNEVATMQIKFLLEESGFTVFTAANGADGLNMINITFPHAIILDLMMPKINGFQVLEQIRSTPGTAQIPVLILTAKELTPEEKDHLKRNNIQQLIQKGNVDRDQLLDSIKKLLKLKRKTTRPTPPSSSREKTSTATTAAPILVVEDNPDNRYIITSILDENGHPYITAADGEEAVSKAKESLPGLILMDIQLPLLSGLEAAKQVKAEPKLANVPIIALTAKAMKGDKEKILSAGCDDYISKPVDPKTLLEVIKKWLD